MTRAMMDNDGNDFTSYIVAFENGYFRSDSGIQWLYAVPIKIEEVKNDCCACGQHRDQ
ncbi:hypothetical protein ACQKC9_13450 [Psychrobacter sp. NPDC078409]|uniref:hypothetical protein n=1 Tax=Psychrobacter sp. NPDC078409 TaxID=3390660 RepID=UPI003D0854B7